METGDYIKRQGIRGAIIIAVLMFAAPFVSEYIVKYLTFLNTIWGLKVALFLSMFALFFPTDFLTKKILQLE